MAAAAVAAAAAAAAAFVMIHPGPGGCHHHDRHVVGYTTVPWCCVSPTDVILHSVDKQVAYGVCSVLVPGSGEAYGVMWTPYSTPKKLQLPLQQGPRPGCYWYKVGFNKLHT
jgi:hypothetical protein